MTDLLGFIVITLMGIFTTVLKYAIITSAVIITARLFGVSI